jgi:large subunit ribosomal protein L15
MYLHELPDTGNKKRKRIGRGPGSGFGKTSGKGHKGAKARSGAKTKRGFEGGQTPINRRLPKFGFTSPNKISYQLVNLKRLESDQRVTADSSLTKEELRGLGLIRSLKQPVKLLGDGTLTKKLHITVDAASQSAIEAVKGLGGDVVIGG